MDDLDRGDRPIDRPAPPAWSSPWEACLLIVRGHTLRTAVVVAGVVGTLLSAVNEGATIASGRFDATTWIRIATNFLVPFVVASVGYLAPFRQRRHSKP
ncbi:MAG: nitrate/nitrite transporter NrtS [Acidimicrobiales bacterium]